MFSEKLWGGFWALLAKNPDFTHNPPQKAKQKRMLV